MPPPVNSALISNSGHTPVFLSGVLDAYRAARQPIRFTWDGTFGRGGHAAAVLREFPEAHVWAVDWDSDAIAHGRTVYATEIESGRLHLRRASYASFVETSALIPDFPKAFDAMMLDLGVSSPQLDQADRGFSFYHDGPLDMRMDQEQTRTAADVVNEWDENDLARLFVEYGEIQRPWRVARAIAHDRKVRPFRTTRELAGLIERVDGWRKKGSHPATRYFLALRLEVNAELRQLENVLPSLVSALAPGGILAVITFHSLEDRIVKNAFKSLLGQGAPLFKKALKPSSEEEKMNPRARSAKLRAFRKTDPQAPAETLDSSDQSQMRKAWKRELRKDGR